MDLDPYFIGKKDLESIFHVVNTLYDTKVREVDNTDTI